MICKKNLRVHPDSSGSNAEKQKGIVKNNSETRIQFFFHLYAMAALVGPAKGINSVFRKPV